MEKIEKQIDQNRMVPQLIKDGSKWIDIDLPEEDHFLRQCALYHGNSYS